MISVGLDDLSSRGASRDIDNSVDCQTSHRRTLSVARSLSPSHKVEISMTASPLPRDERTNVDVTYYVGRAA